MDFVEINRQFPVIFDAFFFCIGACVGSFLNVCIMRLPNGGSILRPASHCACGAPIEWFDNIPIFSWFLLRGKARCCGRKFSFRYPFVELLTAAIFLTLWILTPPQVAVGGMAFASIMVFCTFVDIDTMTLPDFATVGGAIAGFLISATMPDIHNATVADAPLAASVIKSAVLSGTGIAVGSGILYWLRILGECVFRREAMGEGDVILAGCIGAFCGWQGAIFAIFGGSIIGALTLVPIVGTRKLLAKKQNGKSKKSDETESESDPLAVPFGPWLAIGGLLYYIFLRAPVDAYFSAISNAFFGM